MKLNRSLLAGAAIAPLLVAGSAGAAMAGGGGGEDHGGHGGTPAPICTDQPLAGDTSVIKYDEHKIYFGKHRHYHSYGDWQKKHRGGWGKETKGEIVKGHHNKIVGIDIWKTETVHSAETYTVCVDAKTGEVVSTKLKTALAETVNQGPNEFVWIVRDHKSGM